MSSRLMIAGAGSGKTTFLIHEALEIKDAPRSDYYFYRC